jgi:hypothetical protein
LRQAALLTTAGILAAKQLRKNLARSLPLSSWVLACCRQASRAALTSSRDGRRPNAKLDAGGVAEDAGGRGTGEGGDAGNVDDGGGPAAPPGRPTRRAVRRRLGRRLRGRWMVSSASAASVTATIPMRFMSGALHDANVAH